MCGRWNLGRGLLRAMPGRGVRFAFSVDSASGAGPGPSAPAPRCLPQGGQAGTYEVWGWGAERRRARRPGHDAPSAHTAESRGRSPEASGQKGQREHHWECLQGRRSRGPGAGPGAEPGAEPGAGGAELGAWGCPALGARDQGPLWAGSLCMGPRAAGWMCHGSRLDFVV